MDEWPSSSCTAFNGTQGCQLARGFVFFMTIIISILLGAITFFCGAMYLLLKKWSTGIEFIIQHYFPVEQSEIQVAYDRKLQSFKKASISIDSLSEVKKGSTTPVLKDFIPADENLWRKFKEDQLEIKAAKEDYLRLLDWNISVATGRKSMREAIEERSNIIWNPEEHLKEVGNFIKSLKAQ